MSEKPLIMTTDTEPRLEQLGVIYTELLASTTERHRDSNTTYYRVEMPEGTSTIAEESDAHTFCTKVLHLLPDGRILTEVRKSSPQDNQYLSSWFELGREHEGILEPSDKSPGGFHLYYYDSEADQTALQMIATGTAMEIRYNHRFITGRIEHQLPDGYIFVPMAQYGIQPFPLVKGMLARLTFWEYM